MNIKDLDFLSQKISLFYYGRIRHSSGFGGTLSILTCLLSFSYILYHLTNIFKHSSSNFMWYKKYLKDVDIFYFNKNENSIFHYFQFLNTNDKEFGQFNNKYTRIYMTKLFKIYLKNFESLRYHEHWVYDSCRKGIDDKNIPKDAFNDNISTVEGGACIRYYYNVKDKKYYSIDDEKNFKYPYLEYGFSSEKNLFLNTVVEKCNNESILTNLLGNCADLNEIDEYLNKYSVLYLQLLEKNINSENYKNPYFNYINSISSTMELMEVPINNINLNPFHIEIKSGTLYPTTKKIKSYILNTNRQSLWHNNGKRGILAIFDYWLQNNCEVVKGGYETIYDIVPNVGGTVQLIYYVFFFINFLYNQFATFNDMKMLLFKMHNVESDEEEVKKVNKFKNLVYKIRQQNQDIKIISSIFVNSDYNKNSKKYSHKKINSDLFLDLNKNLNSDKNYDTNKKNELNNVSLTPLNFNDTFNRNEEKYIKQNIISDLIPVTRIRYYSMVEKKMKSDNNIILRKFKKNKIPLHKSKLKGMDSIEFYENFKNFIKKQKNKVKFEVLPASYIQEYVSFFHYLISYLIFFGKCTKKELPFYILGNFRKKLLSEEHFCRNQVLVYYLKKYFDIEESQKIDILELYENL